ncbi:MAG: isoaspartyl peptidase/L-asparaginase [Bacteroidia bacterium]|nr:isoaspartyl peptidase/L-asparaginase [Bacteroidia bacterium]
MNKIAIAIHGGAGTLLKSHITPEQEKAHLTALQEALTAGHQVLLDRGSSLEAVEKAVISLEDCPLFNAGRGSVFTAEGKHEMDASMMEGKNLKAGAVSGIHSVKNPISLCRLVMEQTEHVMLSGMGAIEFALKMNVPMETEDWFHSDFRYNQWQEIKGTNHFQLDHTIDPDHKFGTVGAVALDVHGNLAAATSTGGMTNKKYGRVGDSPIIGAGTYANNQTCAVSCTGNGEFFIRGVVAYDISCLMQYKGLSLKEAVGEVIHGRELIRQGDGGLIALDANGNIEMPFNSAGMYRACVHPDGKIEVAIFGQ